MTSKINKDIHRFTSDTYRLTFLDDRPFVRLETPRGERLADLFVLAGVHTIQGRDDTTRIGEWEVEEGPGGTTYLLQAESSLWKAKRYRFRCYPGRFSYEVEIDGHGSLAEVSFFGGYYSGQPRWGSGFFWSGQGFLAGFNPEPNRDEITHFHPGGNSSIDLMGVPLPGRGDWFFTPAPFCFGLQVPDGWLALGVEAGPGHNRFTEYAYHGKPEAFYLSLAYDGQTAVRGTYRLPAIGFDFADGEYTALERHVQALAGLRHAPAGKAAPHWWRAPIFCGWGAQSYLSESRGGRAPEYARQDVYEGFLDTLEAAGVDPGIVVIDDKWQATYGENCADDEKWPDLPAFIARQHARGRKVLLWLKAWDAEGIPAGECVTNAAGLPVACDPSNPAYERRLRAAVRRMISPGAYDADGFKVDFTARIPAGPGLHIHGDTWGLELMRLYLSILHSEARRAKPDALIMAHTPHPYLEDVVDMIRLNDINHDRDIPRAMAHRGRVASIACPNLCIDTDDWPMPDKAAWRAYMDQQPGLGVPSLYYVTHIDSTGEALDADDYRLIRQAWARYREAAVTPAPAAEPGPDMQAGGLSLQPLLPAEG